LPGVKPSTAPKAIVVDVLIQGNRLVATECIKNQMKTRTGRVYVPDTLQEDVRTLFATRQFANVWADVEHLSPKQVRIRVFVRDFSRIIQRVTWRGNHNLTNEDLEQLTSIRAGMPLNPLANKVACRRIVARYNEEGRPFASCDLVKGGHPEDNEVIFSITEGPKVKVRDLEFTGNTFVSSAVLKTHIQSSAMILGLIGGTWSAALAENDVHELIKYYRSFGFHDVQVNREVAYSKDGREVTLIFHIQEGIRYRLAAAPRLAGVKSATAQILQGVSTVKEGDFYDEIKINKDTARIRDYFGYRGHAVQATALPVFTEDQPGRVLLTYEVKEK
jgi:outer membrane protein assembly factor BamA